MRVFSNLIERFPIRQLPQQQLSTTKPGNKSYPHYLSFSTFYQPHPTSYWCRPSPLKALLQSLPRKGFSQCCHSQGSLKAIKAHWLCDTGAHWDSPSSLESRIKCGKIMILIFNYMVNYWMSSYPTETRLWKLDFNVQYIPEYVSGHMWQTSRGENYCSPALRDIARYTFQNFRYWLN